jgi:cation/acetate symporter
VLGSGVLGDLRGALVAAGAFAAFLSSSSGLVTSVAGVLSTDVLGRGSLRDAADPTARRGTNRTAFRVAAIVAGVVPFVLSLSVATLDVSLVVGLAFAVAASSFCPLLVLGIWWRGLTDLGAAAGVLVGGGGCVVAVLLTYLGRTGTGLTASLLHFPGAWTVPLAFAVMVGVSLATRHRVPGNVGLVMLRLHAPEPLRPRTG